MELFRIFGTIDIESGNAEKELGKISKSSETLARELGDIEGETKKTGGGFKGMASSLGKFASKVGVFKVVDAGLGMITSSVGSAVKRFDTLENSNKVFENMGFAIGDTKVMMDKLITSVTGLPTPMEDAVQGVQRIVSATGDLEASEKIYSALNDGVLAFGGSNEQVNSSIEMFSRGLQTGRIDGQQFNSLMSNMGPVINAVGKEMGYTTDELQKGLSDGSISVDDFTDTLIKLDVEGGGGLASLDQMARDMTGGIGTAMANVQNAVNRGMASIIEKTNEVLEDNGFPNIAELVAMFGRRMEKSMKASAEVIGLFLQVILSMVGWVNENFPELGETISAIMGSVSDVIKTTVGFITTLWDIFGESIMSIVAYVFKPMAIAVNLVMQTMASVIKVITSLIAGDWEGVWTGVRNFFTAIWTAITRSFQNQRSLVDIAVNIFNAVMKAILTPITKARDLIKGALDTIKGFFSGLKLSFPKISMPKLPRFSLKGKFSLAPPSVPTVGVNWNAKGGIFKQPTIFNTANAGMQGVGEADSEAIIPLNTKTLGGIGDGIAQTMQGNNQGGTDINKLVFAFKNMLENIEFEIQDGGDSFKAIIDNRLIEVL